MRKDFHYYCIKTLAYYAGFTQEAAEIIAYASQSVDEEKDITKYISMKKFTNEYQKILSFNKEERLKHEFNYVPTYADFYAAHPYYRYGCLIPFHFMTQYAFSREGKYIGNIDKNLSVNKLDNNKVMKNAISYAKQEKIIVIFDPGEKENGYRKDFSNIGKQIFNKLKSYTFVYFAPDHLVRKKNGIELKYYSESDFGNSWWITHNPSIGKIKDNIEVSDPEDLEYDTINTVSLLMEHVKNRFENVLKLNESKLNKNKNVSKESQRVTGADIIHLESIAALIKLGIALHTYADTWAHQDFSGRLSETENDVDKVTVFVDESSITEKTQRISTKEDSWIYSDNVDKYLFFYKRANIGHANAGSFPDYSHITLNLEFDEDHPKETSYNQELKFGDKIKARHNTETFLEAAVYCFNILKQITEIIKTNTDSILYKTYINQSNLKKSNVWNEIKDKIGECFATFNPKHFPGYQLGTDTDGNKYKKIFEWEYDKKNYYSKPKSDPKVSDSNGNLYKYKRIDEKGNLFYTLFGKEEEVIITWGINIYDDESSLRAKQSKWRSVFSTIFKDDPYYIKNDINKYIWRNYFEKYVANEVCDFKPILWPLFFREAKDQRDFMISLYSFKNEYSLAYIVKNGFCSYEDLWLKNFYTYLK